MLSSSIFSQTDDFAADDAVLKVDLQTISIIGLDQTIIIFVLGRNFLRSRGAKSVLLQPFQIFFRPDIPQSFLPFVYFFLFKLRPNKMSFLDIFSNLKPKSSFHDGPH